MFIVIPAGIHSQPITVSIIFPPPFLFAPPSVLLPPQRSHEKPWASTTGATNLSWLGSSSIFLNSTNQLHHLWNTSNRGFKSSKIRKDFFGGDGNFKGVFTFQVFDGLQNSRPVSFGVSLHFFPLCGWAFPRSNFSGLKPEKKHDKPAGKKRFCESRTAGGCRKTPPAKVMDIKKLESALRIENHTDFCQIFCSKV